MANYIINSTGTIAVKKSDIVFLRIVQLTHAVGQGNIELGDWVLSIGTSVNSDKYDIPFEVGTSKEIVQALAAPIIVELEL